MSLNFPSNPSDGQKFPDPAQEGVGQWTYDSSKGVWTGGISSGSGDGSAFEPISIGFTVDTGTSNRQHADYWESRDSRNVIAAYPGDWANYTGGALNRIEGVLRSNEVSVTMPPGATAAALFFYGAVATSIPRNAPDNPNPTYRNSHTAHRLLVQGGNVGINGIGFGLALGCSLITPSVNENIINARYERTTYEKHDILTFNEGATIKFQSRMDAIRGGRIEFDFTAGNIVILPMTGSTQLRSMMESKLQNNSLDYHEYDLTDAEYTDILNQVLGPFDPKEEITLDGKEYRDRIRRTISALESRKISPVPGTSVSEYDTMIGKYWTLVDRTDAGVHTSSGFLAALQALELEASDPKYGIALTLEFERQAGITRTSLM